MTGMNLRVERVKAGATQRDIGRYMGISAARVSVIERHRGAVERDTAQRFVSAVGAFLREKESGEPQTWQVDVLQGRGDVRDQYVAAKQQARADVRSWPSHRTVEVKITRDTPAATVLGYLDGLEASGVLPVVLDAHGIIVNRRIG